MTARVWYGLAAAKGHPVGLCNLAAMTYHGLGGPADMAQAFALYQRAAEKDSVEAWYNLANMHRLGHGTPKVGPLHWTGRDGAIMRRDFSVVWWQCEQTADYLLSLVKRVSSGEIKLGDQS